MVYNTRDLRGSVQKSGFAAILYPFYRERQELPTEEFYGSVNEISLSVSEFSSHTKNELPSGKLKVPIGPVFLLRT